MALRFPKLSFTIEACALRFCASANKNTNQTWPLLVLWQANGMGSRLFKSYWHGGYQIDRNHPIISRCTYMSSICLNILSFCMIIITTYLFSKLFYSTQVIFLGTAPETLFRSTWFLRFAHSLRIGPQQLAVSLAARTAFPGASIARLHIISYFSEDHNNKMKWKCLIYTYYDYNSCKYGFHADSSISEWFDQNPLKFKCLLAD